MVMASTKSAKSWAKFKACLKLGTMIFLFAVDLSDLDAFQFEPSRFFFNLVSNDSFFEAREKTSLGD